MTSTQHRLSPVSRLFVALAMALVIAVTSGVVGATPASAWARIEAVGRPGKVALSPPIGD